MLRSEITIAYCESHMKHIQRGNKTKEFRNIKADGTYIYHMVSKWLRTNPSRYLLSLSLAVSS